MKQLLALLLVAAMTVSMLPVSLAEETLGMIAGEETEEILPESEEPVITAEAVETAVTVRFACAAAVSVFDAAYQYVEAAEHNLYLLEPGSYFYSVHAEGFQTIDLRPLTVPAGQAELTVPVELQPAILPEESHPVQETESAEEVLPADEEYELPEELAEEAEPIFVQTEPDPLADFALPTPVLKSVKNDIGGVTVTWNAVSGAVKYCVYSKTGSEKWVKRGVTDETSFTCTGLTSGSTYAFTVRCADKSGAPVSGYNATGLSIQYLSAPELTEIVNSNAGATVKWKAVPGAAKYAVFYRVPSSGWIEAGITSRTSFTVTGLTSGTTYSYTVRCASASKTYTSAYIAPGMSSIYLSNPVLKSVSNVLGGVSVTWNALSGAAKYAVYSKTGSENWVKRGVTDETSFTCTGLTSGKTYSFTVRCVNNSGAPISGYDATGLSIQYLAAPELTEVVNSASGATVKWKAVPGATKYAVFYRTASSAWKEVAITSGTSYTVTGLTSGTTYTFTVRCASASKTYTSAYNPTGMSSKYLSVPVLSAVGCNTEGVNVKWAAVPGAVKYAVFCKTGSGGWIQKGVTTNTNYTVTNLRSGVSYAFTVRCVAADGTTYMSSYDPTGKSITYIAAPKITYLFNDVGGVTVMWDYINGASQYAVFMKSGNGSWVRQGTTTANGLLVTGLSSGSTYSFTVRCMDDSGRYISAYDTVGKSIKYLAAPVLTGATNAVGGVNVTWQAVPYATGYAVFYREGSTGNWNQVVDCIYSTQYVVNGLTSGKTYYFTVRCVDNVTHEYTSGFQPTGLSRCYVAVPEITAVTNNATGARIQWKAVAGAGQYRVFYKTDRNSWTVAGTTANTSLEIKGLTSGTKYTYSVRAMNAAATAYLSATDEIGYAWTYYSEPVILNLQNVEEGISVHWNAVPGAARYRLFYRVGYGSWITVSDYFTTTAVVDQVPVNGVLTGLNEGTVYNFTVAVVSSDGKRLVSSFDPYGNSINYTPVSMASGLCGSNLKWRLSYSGTLTVSGTGAMYDYVYASSNDAPWASYRSSIRNVVIQSGVTTIGESAFYGCSGLSSVSLPGTLVRIHSSAFERCSSLGYIAIPSSVTYLGRWAFAGTALSGVTIPASVTEIGDGIFASCTSLSAITVAAGNSAFRSLNGILYNASQTSLIQYPAGKSGYCSIPSGVTYIYPSAFYGSIGLTGVAIPSGVTRICNQTFSNCRSLVNVALPTTLSVIESYAFSECRSMASIYFPANVSQIDYCAFQNCTSMSEIRFHGKPSTISSSAFTNVTATAYFERNTGWTISDRKNYGGNLTWKIV